MIKGLVKGVTSGDTIIISGKLPKNPVEGDLPEELTLNLTGVFAPKIANSSKLEEEPYAYESREFLRKKLIGKVVQYKVDYVHNDRKFGHVVFEDKNINAEILENGLAKLSFIPKGHENLYKTDLWTTLQEADKAAKEKKVGIYSSVDKENNNNVRKLSNLQDVDQKLIDDAINKNKEINAVVEHVFNCAIFSVYIPEWSCFAKVNLRFVSIPSNTKDPNLFKKGKAFCERTCLSKDVKLKIYDVDESKTLLCDIVVIGKEQNLAELVLKDGYSKSFTGGTNKNPKVYNLNDINFARNAENQAKSKRSGVWKNEPISENTKVNTKNAEDELGTVKCVMVNSGDSITVLNSKSNEVRIFLSNLKAPSLAKFGTDDQNQPWAFQAKEYVRKKLVGQYITCDFDYVRAINPENAKKKVEQQQKKPVNKAMKFYTVYYPNEKDEQKCLNVELLQHGLANLANYKIENGNPSKEFDNMMKAEQDAKNNKQGLFSSKVPPLCTYSDLISANKTKKKEFVNFLVGLCNLNCVVDYCFSATKLKLRIDQKQCLIPFGLIGVKSFTNDKNNSTLFEKYFKKSYDFVVDTVLQRDGVCDIIQADKMGNYFGTLLFNGKYLGTILIEKGLAVVNERSIDSGKNKYIKEMKEAEATAQKNKVGLWEDEGVAKMLKFGEGLENEQNVDNKKVEEIHKDIKLRITDQIDFDKFYCNFIPNKTLNKIEEVLSKYDEGKKKGVSLSLPIKNGTLCAAKFPDDERYYRGLIKSQNKKKEFEIEFIDYGNIEYVTLDDLIKLDGEISSIPPQAMYCEMAYLKYSKRSMKKAVSKYPDFVDFDKELNGKLCYSYNQDLQVKHGVVVFRKEKDMKSSYHAALLKDAYAKLDRTRNLPDYMKPLDAIEKEAEEKEMGVWDDNEQLDYDQKEEDY